MTLTSCSVATSVAGTPLLETGRFVYKITYETFGGIGWLYDHIVSLDAIEASYILDDFVSEVEERWMRMMGAYQHFSLSCTANLYRLSAFWSHTTMTFI